MRNLKRKICMVLAILVLTVVMAPAVMAADGDSEGSSLWEDIKSAGAGLYQGVKEKAPGWWESIKGAASDVAEAIKENGPGWVESAKDKGSELVDKGKDALQNAGEQASDFLEGQQDEFWERTEQQIYGSGSSGSSGSSSEDSEISSEAEAIAEPEESVKSVESEEPTEPEESTGLEAESSSDEADATLPAPGPSSAVIATAAPEETLKNSMSEGEVYSIRLNAASEQAEQTAWESFWEMMDQDAATRWAILGAFWIIILLAALLLFVREWLRKRER